MYLLKGRLKLFGFQTAFDFKASAYQSALHLFGLNGSQGDGKNDVFNQCAA